MGIGDCFDLLLKQADWFPDKCPLDIFKYDCGPINILVMDLWANEFEFEGVNDSNVDELKQLNRGIFPINYQDKVYKDIVACGDISQIVRLKRKVVGGIACRLENKADVGPNLV